MAARRPAGEGTVRRRADGRWEARVTLPTGERRSVYARTRALAERERRDLLSAAAAGTVRPAPVLVRDHLTEWLARTQPHRAAHTRGKVESIVRVHLLPTFGGQRLEAVTPAALAAYQTTLLRRLAPVTVHGILATLRAVLADAVRLGRLRENPAARVRLVGPGRAAVRPLSADEAAAIVAAVAGHRYQAAYLLALRHGLRAGEVTALRWVDVDLAAATVQVAGALVRIPGRVRTAGQGSYERGPAKTAGSHRTVPLFRDVVAALAAHRAAMAAEGWAVTGPAAVFVTAAGTVQTPGQLGKQWAALGRRAGLPPRPLRTLRHGAASRLLAAGVPVPVVQAMLGHATPTMTLSVYARLPSDELRRWVARLDRGDAGEGVNGGVKPGRDGRS